MSEDERDSGREPGEAADRQPEEATPAGDGPGGEHGPGERPPGEADAAGSVEPPREEPPAGRERSGSGEGPSAPDEPADEHARPADAARPRRLLRSRRDRVIGGVGGGLGTYFGIDPVIVRIGLAALALAGGVGIFVYLAALLFVPSEPPEPGAEPSPRPRAATIVGGVLLAIAALAVLGNLGWWFDPGAFLLLLLGAVIVWLIVRDRDGPVTRSDVIRALGLVAIAIALAALAAATAMASALATAAGYGALVAAVVVALGGALVLSAFRGGRRGGWLAAVALLVAVPLGVVAAADIELEGGTGAREYRPASAADIPPRYKLGAGELRIDLRDADLPPGDQPLRVDLDMGEVEVIVPEDVCVETNARVGVGEVRVFDRRNGGFDVDWRDAPGSSPAVPRLVVDADIGFGALHVLNRPFEDSVDERELEDLERGDFDGPPNRGRDWGGGFRRPERFDPGSNAACNSTAQLDLRGASDEKP